MAKKSKKVKAEVKMFPAIEVFAAACAAYRINNKNYYKDTVVSQTPDAEGNYPVLGHANKVTMRSILMEERKNPDWVIISEDRENAVTIRDYWQCKLMDVLIGTASEFVRTVVDLSNREEFAANDWLGLATVASLPSSYEKSMERDRRKEVKLEATICSSHFGAIGDKVSGSAEVIDCNYNINWDVYIVTAKFNGNVISFTYRNKLDIGVVVNFKGTIKYHRDNSTTQLTRVRII